MSNNATRKPAWVIGEDWASVVAGFLIIALILLASYNIQPPSFAGKAGWGVLTLCWMVCFQASKPLPHQPLLVYSW